MKDLERESSLKAWLVFLSGLAPIYELGGQILIPVRAHTRVAGRIPSEGCTAGSQFMIFPYR